MKNCCYKCEERHYCCWSHCEKYAEYRKGVDKAREAEAKRKAADGFFAEMVEYVKKKSGK